MVRPFRTVRRGPLVVAGYSSGFSPRARAVRPMVRSGSLLQAFSARSSYYIVSFFFLNLS
jgi:predicted dehydrogenase